MRKRFWVRTIAMLVLICTMMTIFSGCGLLGYLPLLTRQKKTEITKDPTLLNEPIIPQEEETFPQDETLAPEEPEVEFDQDVDEEIFVGTTEVADRDGFIRAKLLNVRSAPGESSPLVAQLPKGTFVHVYETAEVEGGVWARVDEGWVYGRHVYYPGDEGKISGYAVVRDNGAKVKTRVLESGETVESLKAGKRVAFLEKLEMQNGDSWIYIDGGWINGKDVYIEGDEGKRPAHGIVVDETPLNVRRGPGTNYDIIRSMPYGTEVYVFERINRGKFDWGFVGDGWIYMEHVSLDYDG